MRNNTLLQVTSCCRRQHYEGLSEGDEGQYHISMLLIVVTGSIASKLKNLSSKVLSEDDGEVNLSKD
jgi:hypothetical protein